ncbi:MAG: glycosyltransferase family 4 protein [Nitratireductor sp.]
MGKTIGIVLKGYPRLSETFIAQEILELERAGFDLELISLRHPTDKAQHPIHREIAAPVHYLPEYLHDEPGRVLKALWSAMRMPGFGKAGLAFLRDLARDLTRNRVRRFGQGLVLAAEYTPRLSLLYAHFIHTPASATRYAAIIAGLPWSVSAHAKDIWTTPAWELREKLVGCEWCVTCTSGGRDELASHAPDPTKVALVYHGIDLARFPQSLPHSARNGSDPSDPVRLLTVGRAVAKKGIDTILDALALLPGDMHWQWTHIGGGPLKPDLQAQAVRLGIADRCIFLGALPQAEVLQTYRDCDLFVLPCRIDETGDRDGLPNVIVEAQSQALAVISTPISGIPELIRDHVNGRFVQPDNHSELASAIAGLCQDPVKRIALGLEGERLVRTRFDHKAAIRDLIAKLQASLDKAGEGTRP